jgi:hypothetical protein
MHLRRLALSALFLGTGAVAHAESKAPVKIPAVAPVVVNLGEIGRQPMGPAPKRLIRPENEIVITFKGEHNPILGTQQISQPVLQANEVTPRPVADFSGLGDDGFADPPDTNGSVGPNHVVTTLNNGLRVQTRTGGSVVQEYIENFVGSALPANNYISDPHMVYDPNDQRWIFTVLYFDQSFSSGGLIVGASQSSDPTGNWNLYTIPNQDPDFTFVDYPTLGWNQDWIVIATNNFSQSSVRANVWVLSRDAVMTGGSASATVFFEDQGYTLVPAWGYDPAVPVVYLVEDWSGADGELRLGQVSNNAGTPVYTLGGVAFAPKPWQEPDGSDFAPQKGTSHKLDAGDGRINNAIYKNGSLWASHGVFVAGGPQGSHEVADWYEIQPPATITSNVNVTQQGRVEDASGKFHYTYDSIAVNDAGDVLIGGSRFSSDTFPSAYIAFHGASDGASTTRAPYVYKAGLNFVSKPQDTRWGDYSATVTDPDGKTFWTVNEYGEASSNHWGTWWAHVDPAQNATETPGKKPACGCDLSGDATGLMLPSLMALGGLAAFFRRRRA